MTRRAPATDEQARRALALFPGVSGPVRRFGTGLINDTFAVADAFVLQRVHPVFAPEVHHNIVAVTEHLAARGVATPMMRRAKDGRPWAESDAAVWRVMDRLAGTTFDAARDADQVRSAGAVLGRFHAALRDLDHAFVGLRTGVHDTAAHLAALERAVAEGRAHRLYDDVASLADAILADAAALAPVGDIPQRIVHGDPKFSNVIFEPATTAVALIDLDTVGPMELHLELGDAWRSWCNRVGEDRSTAVFDLDFFAAALEGYASTALVPTPAERDALAVGVDWITIELAARFAADALREDYFGYDATSYPAAGEHNLVRARGQWSLHRVVVANRGERESGIRAVWSA